MAPVAISRQVVTAAVAFLAVQAPVGSFQAKEPVVIEIGPAPGVGTVSVTGFTIQGKTRLPVVRVGRAVVVAHMASGAIR
jgi:hypothetical protein